MGESIKTISVSELKKEKWTYVFCILFYTILINYTCVFHFEKAYEMNYEGLLFIYSFNIYKYLISIIFTSITCYYTYLHSKRKTFTDIVMLMLNFLYFIPGYVQLATTNASWGYIFYYFIFYLGLEFWISHIKSNDTNSLAKIFPRFKIKKYLFLMTLVGLAVSALIFVYNNKSFSIANIIATFADVYEVRAEAKDMGTHWIIITFEYWAFYFLVLMLAYYSERRKWLISIVLILTGIALFLIQANRIFVFLIVAAFGMGLVKCNVKKLLYIFVFLSIFIIVETAINEEGLVITNIFRRYSVVPNRIGEFYFDYFLDHTPDYLRTNYSRICALFGIPSPYEYNPIGSTIGLNYFGWEVNCNNGLAGGSMFCFGLLAPLLSTFGYIMVFRIYEGTLRCVGKTQIPYALAFILASLAVNSSALLANIFSISYFSLLYLTLIPLGHKQNESFIH